MCNDRFALGTDSEGDADTETPRARTVNAADVTGSGRGRYSRDTVATRRTHADQGHAYLEAQCRFEANHSWNHPQHIRIQRPRVNVGSRVVVGL